MVQTSRGGIALVPMSWLTNDAFCETLEVGEQSYTFTSLINFSETFEGREDD